MKKTYFLLMFMYATNVFGQSYSCNYKGILVVGNTDTTNVIATVDTAHLENTAFGIISFDMVSYSDKDYAYFKLKIKNTNLNKSIIDEEEEFLLDLNKGVLYDLNSKNYSICGSHDIQTASKLSDNVYQFISGNDFGKITVDSSVPSILTGKVILKNNAFGVRSITTKKQQITLIDFSVSKFDMKKKVSQFKKKCKSKGKPHSALFIGQ